MHGNKIFTFIGTVESVQLNLTTTAVFLPHHINIELPRGRMKVVGLMNGAPFSLALQYRKDVGRYFSISVALRKLARIDVGDVVNVTFRLMDLEKVEISQEGETMFDEKDRKGQTWKKFSMRLDHALAVYVDSAKKIDNRMKRAIEMVQRSKSELRQTQSARKKKNS